MNVPQRADLLTWECFDLAESSAVGRLCFLDGDTPIVYPVSFKLHRGDNSSFVVIRTGRESLMARYAGPASFEIDYIDVASRSAWSVLFRGVVRLSHETDNLPVPQPWIVEGRHAWLLLEIATTSGRRFIGREDDDGYSVEWQLASTDQGPAI